MDVSPSVDSPTAAVDAAVTAQELGFDFVSANDHFHQAGPRLEAWTMLSWMAASTTRIRVATRVLGLPYRHPAVLAKMAETFDRLSRGRLILGLGAGSGEHEYSALGLTVPPLRARIAALEEAIQIIRGVWAAPNVTQRGRFYSIRDLEIEPKPAHAIPIWLGTVGERGLALVGRNADGWFPSLAFAPPNRVPLMVRRIEASARQVGRDPDAVRKIYNLEVCITERPQAPSPGLVAGTAAQFVAHLERFARLGFNGFNFVPRGDDIAEQVNRLGFEVLPLARARLRDVRLSSDRPLG